MADEGKRDQIYGDGRKYTVMVTLGGGAMGMSAFGLLFRVGLKLHSSSVGAVPCKQSPDTH